MEDWTTEPCWKSSQCTASTSDTSDDTEHDPIYCSKLVNIPVDIDAALEDECIDMDALNDDGFWLLPTGLSTSASKSSDDSSLEKGRSTTALSTIVLHH
jgi:hypothetical protein